MGSFLATAFGAGLLALLTPCVFPLIPVTLAFFTKQATGAEGKVDHGSVVRLALLYCLGIVAAFVLVGVGLAATVGASGAYRFATHPVTNVAFALLFVVFGLAMLEVFELRLPPRIQVMASGRRGGTLGVLLMGLTFVVTAFTCTAPFVGTVLILAAKADSGAALLKPVLGMTVFASALALPFFLLALFPPLLAKMPRSGAWLTTVKGAMGFLEIAASFKFASNADLAWSLKLLTKPVFLALTAAILGAAGLWLIGRLKLGHNTPSRYPTVVRGGWAGLFFATAVYCLYGLTGRPLDRFTETYLPPAEYGQRRAAPQAGELVWLNAIEKAKAEAKASGKRIFIDFTGHTCVNCRDVETHIFVQPSVQTELARYVLVRLYVDKGDFASQEEGERNLDYEDRSFGELTQPLYGVIDADGKVLGKTDYNTAKNADQMIAWLRANAG